jgi:hypothetical protein
VDEKEMLWRQYELNVELFKHYLKLVLEFSVFFYGITGAVVSYYFAHAAEPHMRYALLLPLAMSIAFASLFTYGAYLASFMRSEIFEVRSALGLATAPDVIVLTVFLFISAALMLAVAVGLAIIIW